MMYRPISSSGYTPCACRDCFDISMDGRLCGLCEPQCDEHGERECQSPHAYDATREEYNE